ncbi:hypothetical protein ANN_07763 [Periplaneta americana]|uniref:Coronin n=1 Tax=Periplaneta americana TaxID=6978 RepID=A0ABQ8T1R7_PERAM|nr:hypothetical protein ANN_07763 [Periplaneta americana]
MASALTFLMRYHTDGDAFLDQIVTGDEIWVSHNTPETKRQSPIQNKRRGMLSRGIVLLHDNAHLHTAASTRELLDQFGWEIFDHPPYSPDLAPSNFHLFTKLKDFLCGTRFGSDEELNKTVNTWLNELAAEEYNTGILKLVNRYDKCLNILCFAANSERVAVPLSGPGGKIAVFELSKTGKLPDGVIPTLVHGTNIMDFAWDPFNNHRLAVACDDGTIRLWLIPEDGLAEPTNEPDAVLAGHSEKIYFIKFHPLAKDVLASGSYDMTVRIWDLATKEERIVLEGHTDQMFSFAWSPCGVYCATVCKDSKLRVYKPRSKTQPIREGKGPVGSRGARVVWALEGRFIVVMGFDKVSERQIQIFKADSLNTSLNTVGLDVSPAILIPFYDEDSSTLFLTGKGDSTIYAFEVTEEAPYLCPLSHHRCNTLHQGLSFLPKHVCDVGNVEFAKALRLTNNTIEPLSFTVPRIKSDLFQDDLFPPTKVTWKATLTSTQWFQGMDKLPSRQSLKPEGMESLSEAQGSAGISEKPAGSKTPGSSTAAGGSFPGSQQPYNRLGWNADISGSTKEKQEQIQRAVSNRMEVNLKLEQDDMEGVDEREWGTLREILTGNRVALKLSFANRVLSLLLTR